MNKEQYHDLLETIEFRDTTTDKDKSYAQDLLKAFGLFEIQSFYKYSKYHESYTRDIIERNVFHLSPLENLNDPAEHAFGSMTVVGDSDHKITIDEYGNLTEKRFYKYLNDKKYYQASKLLKENTLICSLTTEENSRLMWAHYADNHNGICIEYDAQDILVHTAAKLAPILYNNEAPDVDVSDQISFLKSMRKVSFTKQSSWSYEEEWRVSKVVLDKDYSNLTDSEKQNIQNDKDYTFKPKSVTVGYKMRQETKDEIYNLCQMNDIPMFCVESVQGYDLNRVPYKQ